MRGDLFDQTVALLLEHDETGAMGLVVNRPTEFAPQEFLADFDAISDYSGTLYWGGPVRMNRLFTLLRKDEPPEGAQAVVDSVYAVPVDEGLRDARMDPTSLRFFIGYAGWAAGQLNHEMARGSWNIVPTLDETVFGKDPNVLWKRLTPPREHRAIVARSNDWSR